jgi:hypothetical protein
MTGDWYYFCRRQQIKNNKTYYSSGGLCSLKAVCVIYSSVSQFIYLLICSLINDALLVTDYVPTNETIINEWWIWKGLEGSGLGLILRYYHGIRLEGLRETMKTLSQDSRSPGRDFNPGPRENEARVLKTHSPTTLGKSVYKSPWNRNFLESW